MSDNKKWYYEDWTEDCRLGIQYTEHIHSEMSEFQQIDFYKSETFGTFFTLDGLIMVTQKDEFAYHDMICHVPMAVNPNIKNVLIIGGGDGGTAREVSRYRHIEKIDMVEIDERVVRLSQQFLPQTASALNNDERITLYFEDGLEFVKNSSDKTYDLILVDSTDPISVGEGLFTTDFYTNCKRVLSDNGILINQHESPYFSDYRTEMKKANVKIKDVFENVAVYDFHQPTYPSGHWLFGFASKKFDPIKDHKPEEWEKFGLKTKYYNSNLHKASFCLPTYAMEELNEKN